MDAQIVEQHQRDPSARLGALDGSTELGTEGSSSSTRPKPYSLRLLPGASTSSFSPSGQREGVGGWAVAARSRRAGRVPERAPGAGLDASG
jgi:hypothetical protein